MGQLSPEPQAVLPPSAKPTEVSAPRRKSVTREYVEALLVALALALFIRTFFLQAYKIPSGSMETTLLIGDHILVNKIVYGLRMPESILGLRSRGFLMAGICLTWSRFAAAMWWCLFSRPIEARTLSSG